jgi:hypothetical protein
MDFINAYSSPGAPSDSVPDYLKGFISGEIINLCMAKKARIEILYQ